MEVLYPRCAGLDVHADSVTACVRLASGHGRHVPTSHCVDDHARAAGARGLARPPRMHARGDGSHGRVLEARLACARGAVHARPRQRDAHSQRPGSQERHERCDVDRRPVGARLIRSSFVPPAPIQELRDLTRTRKQLVREIARHTLRIQKTLEDANLKLTQVISDILGTSGRAILKALDRGRNGPGAVGRPHDGPAESHAARN